MVVVVIWMASCRKPKIVCLFVVLRCAVLCRSRFVLLCSNWIVTDIVMDTKILRFWVSKVVWHDLKSLTIRIRIVMPEKFF
jgi:hypothetical protein